MIQNRHHSHCFSVRNSQFAVSVVWLFCPLLSFFFFHACRGVAFLPVTVAAMTDANFIAMARGFGSMLPPERQAFWDGVLQNYEDGIFTQELVLQNLYAL